MSSRGELQLQLARVVSATRVARLLNPDNSAGRALSLEEAVACGAAFFVTPRPDLLVIDADLPADPEEGARRCAAFDLIVEAADRVGVAHVVVASGRPGHRHAYLLAGTGQDRALVEQWCRNNGLDIRTQGVRPPGALHRDGRHVAVPISPVEPAEAVEVLSGQVNRAAVARLARSLVPVQLPARVRAALAHGHEAAGYESPSHARMALAVAIRASNGPRALLASLLADRSSPLGRTFRARPASWQAVELRRLWDKAGDWIATRPEHNPSRGQVHAWSAAVAAAQWKGMAGATDLAVAEAFAALAVKAATTRVAFALADLAVAAGISKDTARASVRRLCAAGWLAVYAEASARTARVYQLKVPAGAEVDPSQVPPDSSPGETGADLGSDLARWSALGKASMRVARALPTGTVVVADLAARLRMSPAAVRYHLRKLAAHGLVCSDGRGYFHDGAATDPAALGELAARLGVAGARASQAEQVRRDRAERATMLQRYRQQWRERHRPGLVRAGLVVQPAA